MAKGSKVKKSDGAKRNAPAKSKAPAKKRERSAGAPGNARSIGASALQLAEDHPIIGDIVVAGLLAAAAALAEDKKVKGLLDAMVGGTGEAAHSGGGSDKGAVKKALKAAAGAIGKSLLDEIWKGKMAKGGKA